MSFENRQIRKKEKKVIKKRRLALIAYLKKIFAILKGKKQSGRFNFIFAFILALVGICIVIQIFFETFLAIKTLNPINVFSSGLAKDDFGQTNFLLAGVGGLGHDGADLTDTLMVISINSKKNRVTMLSLPRDLFVEAPELKSGQRINKIYEITKEKYGSRTGLLILKKTVESIVDLPIHYHLKVNFQAFTKIIDALGGLVIKVEKTINDPKYPDKNMIGFDLFYLPAGRQVLDGETALKYARSRKTTSDFDRADRQQKIIEALREKVFSLKLLTSPSKIKNIYQIIRENIETNLTFKKILKLASLAKKTKKGDISAYVLNNSCSFPEEICLTGGLLYTPERRLYGGAFILLPSDNNWEKIHHFSHLIFRHGELLSGQYTLEILNGLGMAGAAGQAAEIMKIYGLPVTRIGNAINKEKIEETTYFVKDYEKNEKFIEKLQTFIPGKVIKGLSKYSERGIDVVLVIGKTFDLKAK